MVNPHASIERGILLIALVLMITSILHQSWYLREDVPNPLNPDQDLKITYGLVYIKTDMSVDVYGQELRDTTIYLYNTESYYEEFEYLSSYNIVRFTLFLISIVCVLIFLVLVFSIIIERANFEQLAKKLRKLTMPIIIIAAILSFIAILFFYFEFPSALENDVGKDPGGSFSDSFFFSLTGTFLMLLYAFVLILHSYKYKAMAIEIRQNIETTQATLQALGLSIDDERGVLDSARHAFENGKFDDATRYLDEANHLRQEMERARADAIKALTEARNHIANVKGAGVDVSDIEKISAMAGKLFDGHDFHEATNLAMKCLGLVKNRMMESLPDIVIDFGGSIKPNQWNRVKIHVKNTGTANAKDLALTITGTLEVKGLSSIRLLRYGEERIHEIGVRSSEPGLVPLEIHAHMKRSQDNKELDLNLLTWIEVDRDIETLPPIATTPSTFESKIEMQISEGVSESPENERRLIDKTGFRTINLRTYCEACGGVIDMGTNAYVCSCGTALHESCAGKVGICPRCKKRIASD